MSSHEPTEYNEYVGQETVKCEYKEFTFNLVGLALENKLAEQYCHTNQFDFNTNVIANLKKYFQVYLGKYACGFFNSGGIRTSLPKGNVKIGNIYELMPFENESITPSRSVMMYSKSDTMGFISPTY
jgi:hypothetical protein